MKAGTELCCFSVAHCGEATAGARVGPALSRVGGCSGLERSLAEGRRLRRGLPKPEVVAEAEGCFRVGSRRLVSMPEQSRMGIVEAGRSGAAVEVEQRVNHEGNGVCLQAWQRDRSVRTVG